MEENYDSSQKIAYDQESSKHYCPHCKCDKFVKFKYFNNNKINQPRYECVECKKLFQANNQRKQHLEGYSKPHKIEPSHFAEQPKVCPHCGNDKTIKFIGFNNNKNDQPRYRCNGGCKKPFSPFGPRRSHQMQILQEETMKNQEESVKDEEESIGNLGKSIGNKGNSIGNQDESITRSEKIDLNHQESGFFPPFWL